MQTREAGSAPTGVATTAPLLQAVNISKSYGHIQALAEVSLEVHPGQVIGLVGDNGAGKSTLVNIIAGATRPSSGTLRIDGREVSFASALAARMAGIEAV
jgi:simple sugar transport system ATP-binding protein